MKKDALKKKIWVKLSQEKKADKWTWTINTSEQNFIVDQGL